MKKKPVMKEIDREEVLLTNWNEEMKRYYWNDDENDIDINVNENDDDDDMCGIDIEVMTNYNDDEMTYYWMK